MKHAVIDYGYGTADLFGDFDISSVKQFFYHYANQCFGIRKSISTFKLLELSDSELPLPWRKLEGAMVVLQHSGDTIVWNSCGDKIKSEWD